MNFDLNINNYTKQELMDMFELPTHFDNTLVEQKESLLKDNILNNKEINSDTKNRTVQFLLNAKNIILNEHKPVAKKITELYDSKYELKTTPLNDSDEHMVQERKPELYLSSYPSKFFPGVINPIKKKTIKKNLNIDTRFRDNYYASSSSNFNITLPINIDNVLEMQLNSIELPTTFYVVSKQYGNNFFTIVVNGSSTIITIPDGNYTNQTILKILNKQLSLQGSPFHYVSFIPNLITASGTMQTLIGPDASGISIINEIEIDFQKDKMGNDDHNTPLPLKLGWLLGFRNGNYVGSVNYISESVIDLTGPRYLYLVLDDFNNNVNNHYISAFNSSLLNKNILARISLQANYFSILQQNNLNIVTTPREYFGPINLNNMNIQLLDEYGRIVDLNFMDYSFCITLTLVYDL